MKNNTGKTYSIINRLPHFLDPEKSEGFTGFVSVFASQLKKAELDLIRVLKSHHIETAGNEGSRGYMADNLDRGDLDKLFTVMLEALGGTSCFTSLSSEFSDKLFDAPGLVKTLITGKDPAIEHVRSQFDSNDISKLKNYHVDNIMFKPEEIGPWFARCLLLKKDLSGEESKVSSYIKTKLINNRETWQVFKHYGGANQISRELQLSIAGFLNKVILRDSDFFTSNYESFKELSDELTKKIWALIYSLYNDFFREQYSKLPDQIMDNGVIQENTEKKALLDQLDKAEPPKLGSSDNIIRLNRMLLSVIYRRDDKARGFNEINMPTIKEIRSCLKDKLNEIIKIKDFFTRYRFPGLHEDFDFLEKQFKDKPQWRNRILLENVFPVHIKKSFLPYRERMTGLIRSLAQGASTKQGIMNIVANNLGIIGSGPEAQKERSKIKITEYNPKEMLFFEGKRGFYQGFSLVNPNQDPQESEIKLNILDSLTYGLAEIKVLSGKNHKSINLMDKDILVEDTNILINKKGIFVGGIIKAELVKSELLKLEPGRNDFEIQIKVFDENGISRTPGRFDGRCSFDRSSFVYDRPIIDLEISSVKYQYGKFTIEIPWHIPGFTDLFEEMEDHPRHQIPMLVNKVKAAGIQAMLAYKQIFQEDQNMKENFQLGIDSFHSEKVFEIGDRDFTENHIIDDGNYRIDSRQSGLENHTLGDHFEPAGRFDYTGFNSLNTFK